MFGLSSRSTWSALREEFGERQSTNPGQKLGPVRLVSATIVVSFDAADDQGGRPS